MSPCGLARPRVDAACETRGLSDGRRRLLQRPPASSPPSAHNGAPIWPQRAYVPKPAGLEADPAKFPRTWPGRARRRSIPPRVGDLPDELAAPNADKLQSEANERRAAAHRRAPRPQCAHHERPRRRCPATSASAGLRCNQGQVRRSPRGKGRAADWVAWGWRSRVTMRP